MPEMTKELLKGALERYHGRLVEALAYGALEQPGDLERMFRDVQAIQEQLMLMYKADMAQAEMRIMSALDRDRLQRLQSGGA